MDALKRELFLQAAGRIRNCDCWLFDKTDSSLQTNNGFHEIIFDNNIRHNDKLYIIITDLSTYISMTIKY